MIFNELTIITDCFIITVKKAVMLFVLFKYLNQELTVPKIMINAGNIIYILGNVAGFIHSVLISLTDLHEDVYLEHFLCLYHCSFIWPTLLTVT